MINFSKTNQNRPFKLQSSDFIALTLCAVGLGYYTVTQPIIILVSGFASLFVLALYILFKTLPGIATALGIYHLRPWHVASIILTITIVFGGWETPSHAALFESIEEAVVETLSTAGSTVDPTIVEGIFTFFRIIMILAFVGGAIFLVTQALQGSDWRPVANLLGIELGIVVGLEVLSRLILSTT